MFYTTFFAFYQTLLSRAIKNNTRNWKEEKMRFLLEGLHYVINCSMWHHWHLATECTCDILWHLASMWLATECTFKFNSKLLKQVDRCTMGGPLSVTFPGIYMVKMENDVLLLICRWHL